MKPLLQVAPKRGVPGIAKKAISYRLLRVNVNGAWHEFAIGRDIAPNMTLAFLLREKLGLVGLKLGCDQGACGACTVLMDGKAAVLSCMVLAVQAHERDSEWRLHTSARRNKPCSSRGLISG